MTTIGEPNKPDVLHACILAGGLSSRIGKDKAGLLLEGRTLLDTAIAKAAGLGIPTTVIREDIVDRCGPLGGIITGFAQCEARQILFLPCDMPFVSTEILQAVIAGAGHNPHGACAADGDLAGFPITLNRAAEPAISEQHRRRQFSLQKLVKRLDLARVCSRDPKRELFNINTADDFQAAGRFATDA